MSSPAKIDAKDAACTAEQVEHQLKELGVQQGELAVEQREADHSEPGPGKEEGTFDATEKLVECWRHRLSSLEAKCSKSATAPPPSVEDIDELQSIAEGVARYRQQLIEDCGYRNKDLRQDEDLPELEARLDKLAEHILPGQGGLSVEREEKGLVQWAEEQTAKLANLTQQSTNLSPSERKEVQEIVTEIVRLRGQFAAEGLTKHEWEKHDDMQRCMWRLRDLRRKDHRDKKHDGRQHAEAKTVKEEAEKLNRQIEEHRKRMMEEKGLTHKEAKEDPVLAELQQRYSAICQIAGA